MENNLKTIEENESLQKELFHLAKQRKFKRKLITFGVIFLLLIFVVLLVWFSGKSSAKKASEAKIAELSAQIQAQEDQIQELINTPIVVNPVAPEISLEILYSEIKGISELATMEYLFTDANIFKDSQQIKNWNVPLTEKSFTMKWDGVIKAGVNLELVSIDVDETNKKITVSMPAAEILSYEVDNDSVEILDERNNIFNKITVDDKVKFDAANETAMKKRAIENGLLEKAQKNAEDILLRLLTANPAIGNNYVIEFETVE